VAERVVDLLEAVDIEEHEREPAVVADGPGHLGLQRVAEGLASQ
jgi:hypothetical protein